MQLRKSIKTYRTSNIYINRAKQNRIVKDSIVQWTPVIIDDKWVAHSPLAQNAIEAFYPVRNKIFRDTKIDIFSYKSFFSGYGNPCVLLILHYLLANDGGEDVHGVPLNIINIRKKAIKVLTREETIYNDSKFIREAFGLGKKSLLSEIIMILSSSGHIIESFIEKGKYLFFLNGIPEWYKLSETGNIICDVSVVNGGYIVKDVSKMPRHLQALCEEEVKIGINNYLENAIKGYTHGDYTIDVGDIQAISSVEGDGKSRVIIKPKVYLHLKKDKKFISFIKRGKIFKEVDIIQNSKEGLSGELMELIKEKFGISEMDLLLFLASNYMETHSLSKAYLEIMKEPYTNVLAEDVEKMGNSLKQRRYLLRPKLKKMLNFLKNP